MSKQYGLINPKKDAPKFKKLSAFDSDSDSDTKETTSKKPNVDLGLIQKKQIDRAHNAALSEDPTIFQYDELYDEIKNERETAKVVKKNEQKNVKYISKLLESADRRKKEYERRIERQVQKERETEGEMYKDKEAFVTSSYKAKLEEMKKAEEEEKRFDYLEAIGDVTKQRDLGGFYRHLYEQRMGPKDPVDATKTETVTKPESSPEPENSEAEPVQIKKAKEHIKKERVYRKRKSSTHASDEEDDTSGVDAKSLAKKAHLQSNLDADSDFSIDSHSDEEEKKEQEDAPANIKHQPTDVLTKNETQSANATTESEDKSKNVPKNDKVESSGTIAKEANGADVVVEESKNAPKIDKKKIWEKRTVGDVLVTAIQRYYERKLQREG